MKVTGHRVLISVADDRRAWSLLVVCFLRFSPDVSPAIPTRASRKETLLQRDFWAVSHFLVVGRVQLFLCSNTTMVIRGEHGYIGCFLQIECFHGPRGGEITFWFQYDALASADRPTLALARFKMKIDGSPGWKETKREPEIDHRPSLLSRRQVNSLIVWTTRIPGRQTLS